MESLFTMSETAVQTAMLLRSRLAPKLEPQHIDRVLKLYDGNFATVKLTEKGKTRFGGA